MPNHGHRVYIDVPRPRTPPRTSSQRIQVIRTTTGTSPRRSSFRRHSLVLDDDDRPVLSSTTTTTSSSGIGAGGGLFFRDDPTLAGAMLSTPDSSAYTLRSGPPPSSAATAQLKAQVQVKDQTIRELHVRCEQLELENLDLRRSLDSSSSSEARRSADVESQLARARRKNARLDEENEALRTRVREAVRQAKEAIDERVRLLKTEVAVLGRQVGEWRGRFEDAERRALDSERRLARLRENLDDYVEANGKLVAENDRLRRDRDDGGRRRRS
ncbi:hypothetical protein B0T18DRAFT_210101 [Schizothecium vesticola]|uniref:Uncharacterized protein n=1 Tax=Schizothecium vesticola TaxID=314040 RepID=A0AA40EJG9_9PEZI|nr:hypothetical protein B0T18DRAFT_210101 [Schizothecium vesticola]